MHQLVIKRFQHCLMHGVTMKFILSIFINLYMFRATMCPSSGETTVFLPHLVLGILCGWVWFAGWNETVSFYPAYHRITSTKCSKNTFVFSWWWAHSRPKHVETDKYTKNKFVHQVGFIYKIIQRCTINRTLKKYILCAFALNGKPLIRNWWE